MKAKFLFSTLLFSLAIIGFLRIPLTAQRTAIGNLLVEGIGDFPTSVTERLEQYQNIRSAGFADWDASGKGLYISTRFGDVAQIHHVAKAGGYRQQLTFFKEPVTGVRTCPDPKKDGFLYSQDVGGNEQFQVYYMDRKTGTTSLITDGKSRNGNSLWNKKGDKIAFSSTKRTGKDVDFYIADLSNPFEARMILKNTGGGWSISDWSSDDSRMIVINSISVNEGKIFMLDILSGKLEELNPSNKQIAYTGAKFSKDGKGIFMISDENSEFRTLRYYDLASRTMTSITTINHDTESLTLSDDLSKLIFVVNEGGYSKPYLMHTNTRKYSPLPIQSFGQISNIRFQKDNNRIAYSFSSTNLTSDVYVHDIKLNRTEQWTFSETGALNPDHFHAAKLIEFPTFDIDPQTGKTRMIPSFLVTPKKANGKLPVLIDIHGGPEGQSVANFNSNRQFWAQELGIAVLVPNIRGSSGYGKTYLKLDNGMLRDDAVKDIGALLNWIATQHDLDASRVAVIGGSYGGTMVLLSMTNFNDRLKCGVDLFGVSNMNTFLKNTSGYRVDLRRVEYGDERDPKMAMYFESISAIKNIQKISKPIFIYQGENDPRVPLSESEQIVEALKQNGGIVSYVRAKDEGHGLAKKANRDYTYSAISWFLQKYLIAE